jgi:hypothetical protein
LAEQGTLNPKVLGSIPGAGTNNASRQQNADWYWERLACVVIRQQAIACYYNNPSL